VNSRDEVNVGVGVLIITHNAIGEQLLNAATATLGFCPLQTASLAVHADCDVDAVENAALTLIDELDGGQGVLVLTDALGATPSNIGTRIARERDLTVIAGVNLPMLLRVFNYPALGLEELAGKAVSGGVDGVVVVQTCSAQPPHTTGRRPSQCLNGK